MTHKERMLMCIQGINTDKLPFAPRLDLWYRANSMAGTLPDKYRNATIDDIIDDLDVGYHAVIPNYQDLISPDDTIDRGLGIFNLRTMPFRTILENVNRKITRKGFRTWVEYQTPVGSVTTCVVYTDDMKRAGITTTHVEKNAIAKPEDYKVIAHIFENARIEENYSGYQEFADYIGDRGIAVGYVNAAASPVHLIQRELISFDQFFFDTMERPDFVMEAAQKLERYWNEMLTVCEKSSADVLLLGANYDSTVTFPPFFEEHIMPWLQKYAAMLHKNKKYLLTHTDGENEGLLDLYLKSGFDIADSVCPAPMTSLSFQQMRQAFKDRITIMGGIPSIILLKDSMSDYDFNAYLDNFFENLEGNNNLILGISDTTPPSADFNRILKIKKYASEI
jgi:uroporphyrinogen-III decarboxylase